MLKSLATTKEQTSPFFKRNKTICEQFYHKAVEAGADVKGSFGAWAFYWIEWLRAHDPVVNNTFKIALV